MRWYYKGGIPVTVNTTDRGPCVVHAKSYFHATRSSVMNLIQSGMVVEHLEPQIDPPHDPLSVPVGEVAVVSEPNVTEPEVEPDLPEPETPVQTGLELDSSTESSDGGAEGDSSVVDLPRQDEPTKTTSRRGRRKRNKRESES